MFPIVRMTKRIVPMDPAHRKIGLLDLVAPVNVDMWKIPPGRLREVYNGTEFVRDPDQETLTKAKNALRATSSKTL